MRISYRRNTRIIMINFLLNKLSSQNNIDILIEGLKIDQYDQKFCQKLYLILKNNYFFIKDFVYKILNDFNGMSNIFEAILITLTAEILFLEMPIPIIVNEYIKISSRYMISSSLLHAIINKIYKKVPNIFVLFSSEICIILIFLIMNYSYNFHNNN